LEKSKRSLIFSLLITELRSLTNGSGTLTPARHVLNPTNASMPAGVCTFPLKSPATTLKQTSGSLLKYILGIGTSLYLNNFSIELL
jgi:hypothetical protein